LVTETIIIDIVTGGTRGLIRDAQIVSEVLESSYQVNINISRQRNLHLIHKRLYKTLENRVRHPHRLLLFFENLPTHWMNLSKTSILIPNQEWMRDEVISNLSKCQEIWCKTRYAEDLFQKRNFQTRYIGFTSLDIYMPSVPKDYNNFIHVAGRSHLKGTQSILELWQVHPEWPTLLVISGNEKWKQSYPLHNVIFLPNSLSDSELKVAMNSYGIHLCPSETEGFGHYISEALSCKSIVITVNAPPMNEIVSSEFGLLAKIDKKEPMGYGERFFVDKPDLELQIQKIIEINLPEKLKRGEAARKRYEEQRRSFQARLNEVIKPLTIL
jgi:glycosyltransferase involved in cell wall biosynthesis